MTKISDLPERLGALILVLGFPFFAGARTQNEQPDAGDDMASAEIVDCRVDRINGSMESQTDADLYRLHVDFFTPFGPAQIDCVSTVDTALLLFDEDGRCVAMADAVAGAGTESIRLRLSEGTYYLFAGSPGTRAYHNQADYDGDVNSYCEAGGSGLGNAGPLHKVKTIGGQTGDYTIRFNFKHGGIGVQPDLACGSLPDPNTHVGWGTRKDKTDLFRTRQRNVTCYYSCKNLYAHRGCITFWAGGQSRKARVKKKFFLLGPSRRNVTAAVTGLDLALDFDPGEIRMIQCRLQPGRAERKKRFTRVNSWLLAQSDLPIGTLDHDYDSCIFRAKIRR